MSLGVFFDRVLDFAVRHGWVRPEAGPRVQSLCSHGPSLEQALLGTGLLTVDQYGQSLSAVSGWPFLRVGQEDGKALQWPSALVSQGMWPLSVDGKAWRIGFVSPEREAIEAAEAHLRSSKRQLSPVIILRADWRKRAGVWESRHPVASFSEQLLQAAEDGGAHTVRIVPLGEVAVATFDRPIPSVRLPAVSLPALTLRLQRFAPLRGWEMDATRAPGGPALTLVRSRASEHHPLEWLSAWRSFQAKPSGLFVFLSPDAYVRRHALSSVEPFLSSASWRKVHPYRVVHADTPEAREEAVHAALYGHALVTATSASEPWWEDAAAGNVPVTVVRGRRTPHGVAWEAFPVSSYAA